jgi:hypothetical protein
MRFAYRGRFGKLAILLALCAGFAPRASAQARGQADGPPDRGVLQSLAGDYQADTITMTVTLQPDGTLTLLFPGQPLYHLEPQGGLRYAIRELPGFAVSFDRDSAGAISQMQVLQRPPQPSFTAIRVRAPTPQAATLQTAQQALAGNYVAGTITLTVTLLEDGTLTLLFPGQPLYHLEPQAGLRYAIRELPGFAVAFDRDSAGAISQMDVLQRPPQPNFTAIRVRTPTPQGATLQTPQQALAGNYVAGTITLTVTLLEDGTLTLLFPGQPLYHLEPQGGLRYGIRELPGFAVAFDRDSAGAISQMDVLQRPPQPNFTAIRVRGAQMP